MRKTNTWSRFSAALAALGVPVALLIDCSAGMKAAPRLTKGEFNAAFPLPLLSILFGIIALVQIYRSGTATSDSAGVAKAYVSICASGFVLLILFDGYLHSQR